MFTFRKCYLKTAFKIFLKTESYLEHLSRLLKCPAFKTRIKTAINWFCGTVTETINTNNLTLGDNSFKQIIREWATMHR
jgi:hypothetical protein